MIKKLINFLCSNKTKHKTNKFEFNYYGIFQSLDTPILIIDPINDKDIVDVNNAALKFYGYTKDEFLKLKIYELNLISKLEVDANFRRLLNRERNVFLLKHKLSNGEIKDISIQSSPIKFDGKIYIFAIIQDLTEQKLQQSVLQKSENMYRSLFDNLTAAFCLHEAIYDENNKAIDFRIIEVNSAFEKMTGLKNIDVIGKTIIEVYKKIEPYWFETYTSVVETGKPAILNNFSGSLGRHYECLAYRPMPNHFAVIFTDITDLMNSQDAIKENGMRFKAIFENSHDGICVLKNGIIQFANPKLIYKLGFNEESELIGLSIDSLFVDNTKDEIMKMVGINLNFDTHASMDLFQTKIARKNGTEFYADLKISNYIQNNITYFIVNIRDISLRKEAEQKIYFSSIDAEERERSRIAKELHDGLGPLLSASKLFAYSLSEDFPEMGNNKLHLKLIQTINQSISTVKEVSNNITPHILISFGLIHALQSFIDNVSIKEKININLKASFNIRFENIVEITLYRVICELINNTLKYAEAKNILLRLDYQDNKILVNYLDDGKGFNVSETLSSSTGMGLVNVKNRIESLKGYITINSTIGDGINVLIAIDNKSI